MIDLIYPDTCVACNDASCIKQDVFCFACKRDVLFTDHFEVKENEVLLRLLGRVNINHGAALLHFIKHGKVQKAIHKLKYGKRGDIATKLGRQMGTKIDSSSLFDRPDIIIPIPLHPKREWKRGYNQSKLFAEGINEILNAEVSVKHLLKKKNIHSQTSKLRSDRFNNVLQSFELKKPYALEGKSILLVDDVLTTGATIEAAIQILQQIPDITLQIALIALAND